jgi:endo-1,4-beta-xylanase
MKKLLVIVCSLLLVFLAACGSGNNDNANNSSNGGGSQVTDNNSNNTNTNTNNGGNQQQEQQPADDSSNEVVVDPADEKLPVLMTKAFMGTPVIDGKIDEIWDSAMMIETGRWVSGTSGATAKVRTLWDENYLYVLAEVTDSLLSKASSNAHEQDSVEIFVDLNNGKTTTYEEDDAQYRINFDNETSFNPSSKSELLQSATSIVDGGYIVEAAISWNGKNVYEFTRIGFDVQVNNDEDGNGTRDSVAIWNDISGNSWQNTSGLGILELAGPAPKVTTAVKGTPTIDGDIDSVWNSANVIDVNQWVQGTSGSTAKVRTLWDENYLYVLFEVKDSLLTKASANVWEQDSIEIFVDLNNAKSSTYQDDDAQYRINFDNEPSFNPSSKESLLTSATKVVDGGYIVEAAIKWDGVTPYSGMVIGFDAQVNNDEDGDGTRDSIAIWNDLTGNSWQNTSGFGMLKLQ